MGLYSSFYDRMDSNGSLCVLIGPYSSLWFLIGPYRFIKDPFAFLCILYGPYRCLCISMVLYEFL